MLATQLPPDRGRAMAGGLDVVRDAQRVRRMIRALAGGGVTVLLTTQYLEEADALADHICVIDHGKVITDGTPADLKRVISEQAVVVRPAEFLTGVRAGLPFVFVPDWRKPCRRRPRIPGEQTSWRRAPPTRFRVVGGKGSR